MGAIQTKNLGFILRQLGREAGPGAFLREITQNGLEAILRTSDPGDVKWDLYWPEFTQDPPYHKLVCVDMGDGMTSEDLLDLIAQVSSSGQEQSATGNFGVGAKISAFCTNEYGLTYMSWTEGNPIGAGITIWWDASINDYAVKLDDQGNETWPIDEEESAILKAQYGIVNHGTIVIFRGNAENENTLVPPPNFQYQNQWIYQYLNARYYEFPAGTRVMVRDTWDPEDTSLLQVAGKKSELDSQSEATGSVALSDATVFYWISQENVKMGQVGLLYQNEIYELLTGIDAFNMLQRGGIKFGGDRIALMIVPVSGIFANLTRTALMDIEGGGVPWSRWMAEFKANMPEAIKELIRRLTPVASNDYKESYHSRLEILINFFMREKDRKSGERRARKTPRGEPRRPLNYPKEIRWVTTADGSRAEGDMENRAAKYILDGELLLINRDFSIHQQMLADIKSNFPGQEADAEALLREWQEQQYVEAILSAKKIGNRSSWSQDALTAVGGVVWNVWNQVTQELQNTIP